MIYASALSSVLHPFYVLFASVLAFYYNLVPNYAIAIALLTISVMVVVFPVTLKGTRGMIKMQLLAPEMKLVQNRYKPKPGMTQDERAANRTKLNEELMALYKENDTSPTGGCVPMFLQLPVFIVLYGTIRGLVAKNKAGMIDPSYISKTSRLYKDIVAGHGHLHAFGINLADSVRTAGSWGARLPFIAMILIAVAMQYIQIKQMSGRNPAAAAANPQMQTMQRVMPLIFAVIYINIPGGVNVYFIISSLFRITQQDAMYRWDPKLQDSMEKLRRNTAANPPATTNAMSIRQRFREAAGGAAGPSNTGSSNGKSPTTDKPSSNGSKGSYTPRGYSNPRTVPRTRNHDGVARSMEWVETTGKTVAEAIGAALDELGVDEHDAEVVVVEEPKSALFGLRKTDARVRARVRPAAARPKRPQRGRRTRGGGSGSGRSSSDGQQTAPVAAAPSSSDGNGSGNNGSGGGQRSGNGSRQRRPKSESNRESAQAARSGEVSTVSVEEQAETVRGFVAGVVEKFGYQAETTVRIEEDQITVEVTGNELGLLIGPRGATLDALQELARTVIQRRSEEHAARVMVDVAGFRAKRSEALATFARSVAGEVLSSGVAEALEPMSSADRKIVHDTINALEGVVTTSEGADPRRYVVVRPASSEELADA